MARLLEDDEIGSFKLGEKIGEGGMAIIYKATQPALKRDVVVKKLKDPNREIIARFKREALISASFSQENVLAIYDFINSGRSYYLVMEYVDGYDLRDIIDYAAPLPSDICALIMRDIARGLEYTHTKNIIHRDIKPSNILISKKGEIKMIDFGVARDEAPSKLTMTGMIVGTPSYMSPEQANGDKLNRQTDIYSLGVLLYEMVTGVKPFTGETNTEVLMKIAKGKFTSPSKHNRDLPYGIVKIIKKAMRKDIRKRYQNATELIRDLEKFIPWRDLANKKDIISRFGENYKTRVKDRTTTSLKYAPLYQGDTLRFWLGTAALILFFAFGSFQMNRFLKNERFAALQLTSNIDHGSIYLNNSYYGDLNTRSHQISNLSPGEYQLKIHGEGSSGIYLANILLPPAQSIQHRADIPGRITNSLASARSVPSDAKLFIDDQYKGNTPVSNLKLSSGNHEIKLIKDGFQIYQQKIDVITNQNYQINITLQPGSANDD
jgi:serine/threonine-protein kinase